MDSLAIQICPKLITIFTSIPFGDILTSGDLQLGHNDLGKPMMVDHIEANNNTPQTASLHAFGKFVPVG